MGDRIAHVLSGRLDELASAAERSGATGPVVGRLLEAASVATMHAVALEFLADTAARDSRREAAEPRPVLSELRDAA